MKNKIFVWVFLTLLSAVFVAAGDVVVKNGEVTADENVTASFFFGDGSQLTGISSSGNCSVDGSCSLITYDSELSYIGNCSVDGSCPDIVYESEFTADTNETTRFNTLTGTDCSGDEKVTGIGADGTVVCEADNYSADTTCDSQSCAVTNTGTLDGYEAADLLDDTNCTADNSCPLITYDSETSSWDQDSSDDITTSNIANQNVNSSTYWANADSFNTSTFQIIGTSLELIWTYFTSTFIELTDSFSGDVTGTYDAILVNDDSHQHGAANITAGTFGSGDFTFPDNVIVDDNITVGGSGNGLIYWNGSHTKIT